MRLYGKMAHFRKVFSNSSSLSYYFPPRTTIMGMVAAALGMERDSYYGELDKLDYAVEALTPLKKLVFGENFLDTDQITTEKLRGRGNRVPITREFIVASDGGFLGYNIYVTYSREVEEGFRRPKFPLSFGQSEMLAWVDGEEVLECEEKEEFDNEEVYGAVPVRSFTVRPEAVHTLEYGMPRRYEEGRMSGVLHDYIFPTEPKAVVVRGRGKGISCNIGGKSKKLVFL